MVNKKRYEAMKADNEAVRWAWELWKKYYDVKDDPEYWRNLLNDISAKSDAGIEYQMFGMAISNILDYRHKSIQQYGDISHASEIYLKDCVRKNEE